MSIKKTAEQILHCIDAQNRELLHVPVRNLREWISNCNLSVCEFARAIQVDRSYVHMWISGKKKPSKTILNKIMVVTGGKIRRFEDLAGD